MEYKTKNEDITDYTNGLVSLAILIAETAQKNNKDYFIGGGFAIDFTIGEITRNHHDIDFHPLLDDYDWWKTWFLNKGYKIKEPAAAAYPETCRVKNQNNDSIVDMWPFKIQDNDLLIKYNSDYINAKRHLTELRKIKYNNTEIWIENPERVLEQKIREAGGESNLRPQDIHDFEVMGKYPLQHA